MKHNILTPLFNSILMLMALSIGLFTTACNSKDEATDTEEYLTTESVAVTAFSLTADIRIMKNLDSVYFSIDLEHGVIFNADSLPKGTNVTKLVPKITYPSSVTSAMIEMTGGTHREGTVNYRTHTNDTIDFTGNVTLTLGTAKDAIKKTYQLKVNVHKEDPDTLYWDRTGTMNLPSRLPNPKAQKSVEFNNGIYSLIQEADGSFTGAFTADIFTGNWKKSVINPAFTPVLESLSSSPDGSLFILSSDGDLMNSTDGESWSRKDTGWNHIIGGYGNALLGSKSQGSSLTMASWPVGAVAEMALPKDFPLSGHSQPVEFSNRWSDNPTIVIFGGLTADGKVSSASWAFDGSQWANIADKALPALEGLSVVNYYSYLNSASNGLLKEFECYMAFGGRDGYGNLNNTVYVTYDHGVNWQRAQEYMQMPEGMEAGFMVDAIAAGTSMQSNLSDRWNLAPKKRLPFVIDGDIIRWDCPYIFLFGGYNNSMTLNSSIRSGVLQRLTFVPLF